MQILNLIESEAVQIYTEVLLNLGDRVTVILCDIDYYRIHSSLDGYQYRQFRVQKWVADALRFWNDNPNFCGMIQQEYFNKLAGKSDGS